MDKTIKITVNNSNIAHPITEEILNQAIKTLNIVFNLSEFKTELSKQSFFCSNRPELCENSAEILGESVYNDFISKQELSINLIVKSLWNPWKRYISGTMGETNPKGNTIVSYTWWMNQNDNKELLIEYATHIGHEIFHTNYFGYIHDPEIGSKNFINQKDVTYMIDDILEKLIRNEISK